MRGLIRVRNDRHSGFWGAGFRCCTPNLGTGLFLDIKIDGVSVGSIGVGETYRGPLSPGQHKVSVLLRPNQLSLSPTRKSFTVAKGQTYTLTAAWHGETVVLL